MKTLRYRLLISYFALILIILFGIIVGFIWSTIKYPIGYRQSNQQLQLAAEWLSARLNSDRAMTPAFLDRVLGNEAKSRNIRIVTFDSNGLVQYDSGNGTLPNLSNFFSQSLSVGQRSEVKLYRGDENRIWFYLILRFEENGYALLTTPRQRISLVSLLRDQLLHPVVIAGSLGILAALILSIWLSSWMNQPLKNMASNAPVMLSDDSKVLNVEGPEEIQKVARTFNELIRQIKSVRHSQKVFLGNVSHDLKTPITSIQGYSRAMLDGTLQSQEEYHNGARIIFDEAERMQRMVEEMLLLTRLEAGSVPINKSEISLQVIIQSIVERLTPQMDAKQIKLKVTFNSTMPCYADGDKIMQVFTNLLDNAIKYTSGGGNIQITGYTSAGKHIVSVKDSGIGISEADQRNIFDRFFQADLSRKSDGKRGVGLGLSIVNQLVLMHDGKITLESKLNEGSTFTVILPAI